MTLLAIALLIVSLALGKGTDKKPNFSSVVIDTGDVIIHPLLLWPCQFLPPYHSALALNKYQILHISGEKGKLYPEIVYVRMFRRFWRHLRVKVLKPNPAHHPIGAQGVIIAARMHKLSAILPFRRLTCNCRHYTDYLVYGRTFGSYWPADPGYWPMDARCPLYRRITPQTNVAAPNFHFEDKAGKPYFLQPKWEDPVAKGAMIEERMIEIERSKRRWEEETRSMIQVERLKLDAS